MSQSQSIQKSTIPTQSKASVGKSHPARSRRINRRADGIVREAPLVRHATDPRARRKREPLARRPMHFRVIDDFGDTPAVTAKEAQLVQSTIERIAHELSKPEREEAEDGDESRSSVEEDITR